ncbi:hypothetical protein RclHR1_31510001 [Rhizophagus clarus]|uniref:C2H2-type domain-containing protein n=1 Tax=Rhizophagus clarus TaxID=94130 RepID=A0A2Z6R6Z7_9GLOM|nr:hypothetical protein RclHR1_31510001 [Rhizophagus clarus]
MADMSDWFIMKDPVEHHQKALEWRRCKSNAERERFVKKEIIHIYDRCGKNFPKLWKLRRHQERQFQCRQKIILKVIQPLPAPLIPPIIQSPKIQENDPEAGPGPAIQAHRDKKSNDIEQQDTIPKELTQKDIIFKECPVGRDPERPHRNHSLMSKWVGKISHPDDNPTYAFIQPIAKPEEYKKLPYMPQLIGLIRPKIKEVLQIELCKKDQIKSAIVALCQYSIAKRKPDDTSEPVEVEKYHRGDMRPILLEGDIEEHITRTIGKIDVQIEETLKKGSGYILERILEITIEAYSYRRATGGSYIPTPEKLANKKCTINPDNQGLIDPEMYRPSEKCLQGALGCYFADKAGKTDYLERHIFRAKSLHQYLDTVKLDGIPMPTPICPRIFNKIEEMNPDIAINVWGWNEELATPKPMIASKNYNRSHIIHLMALTDITKSEERKYGQKNHFLWVKNPDGFPFEKSLDHHQEWYFGLGEVSQRVTMPVKNINDFEEFRNYRRQINAPCIIIADFESLKKKCDTHYGGNMRKLAEEEANSFSYSVYWINTGETWAHSYIVEKMPQKNSSEESIKN